MKKHFFALILAFLLCAEMLPVISSAADLKFTDILPGAWYYDDVKNAVDTGLVDGKTPTTYCPDDYLTYAEAVKLAACMNQKFTMGVITLVNGNPWYKSYADYARTAGIIDRDYDWNAYATRAGYMKIFAHALPDTALPEKNDVPDGSIPDVPANHACAAEIYKLYRAGILQGSDERHSCKPDDNIRRSEVAAILTRMMYADKRLPFTMDAGTQTGSTESGLASGKIVPLEYLSPLDSSSPYFGPRDDGTITDNMNNTYNIYYYQNGGWGDYLVDGKYETFEGRFIIRKEYRDSTSTSIVLIYGDGQLLYGASMTGGTRPKDFRVDISGVKILRVFIQSGGRYYEDAALVNAYLCQKGYSYTNAEVSPSVYPKGSTALASLEWWNKNRSGLGPYDDDPIYDIYGNEYFEYFTGIRDWFTKECDFQEYALDGKYETFTGRFICDPGHSKDYEQVGRIVIYGDDVVLYSGSIEDGGAPIDFAVDIRGVQYLKIEIDSATGSDGVRYMCLVNACLY